MLIFLGGKENCNFRYLHQKHQLYVTIKTEVALHHNFKKIPGSLLTLSWSVLNWLVEVLMLVEVLWAGGIILFDANTVCFGRLHFCQARTVLGFYRNYLPK